MPSATLTSESRTNGHGDGVRAPFLTAAWRHLLFVNYESDPAHLAPYLPPGVELDLFEGRALVSLVGLRFIRTKVLGVPVPFLGAFDQVNLRFYVRRTMPDGQQRPGVVFLRELVPQGMLALAAQLAFHEPMEAAALRSEVPYGGFEAAGRIEYAWRLEGEWYRLATTTRREPRLPELGTETDFLHYRLWNYTRQPDGSTLEFQFEHPRWRTWPVEDADVRVDAAAARLAPALLARPSSAFVAAGSAVKAFDPVRFRAIR
jgi:uncharacterized protein YqjF (DUF2071 family)